MLRVAEPVPALNLPDPGEHIAYRVVSQDKNTELLPNNRFQDVWEISYEGPSGTIATVKIPDREYSAAEVDRQIQTQLHEVESVHQLGPAPHPDNTQQ